MVLKAAHDTPWSATMLGRIASQCPDLPPGAFNVIGRESGVEGFEEYLETKTIAVPVDYPARLEAVGVL